jgi:hypothetical protein
MFHLLWGPKKVGIDGFRHIWRKLPDILEVYNNYLKQDLVYLFCEGQIGNIPSFAGRVVLVIPPLLVCIVAPKQLDNI